MSDSKKKSTIHYRLNQTLSSISASELQAAREAVNEETQNLSEPEIEVEVVSIDSENRITRSNIADLKETGKIADNFMSGIDKISDVLTILVLKFGRASQLLRAVLVLLGVGLMLFGGTLVMGWTALNEIQNLQEQQKEFQKQQKEVLASIEVARKQAADAADRAAAVEKSAPKLIVDEMGQAKLIVKGTSGDPQPSATPGQQQKPKIRSRGESELEIPLDF